MRTLPFVLLLAILAQRVGAAEPLRVMTFNIRYGTADDGENAWPNRRELAFRVIRDFAPDLLGVQEALHFQVEEIGEALDGYTHIGVGRDDGREAGEYAAIFYRADRLELLESGTFWLSDTPEKAGSKSWGNDVVRCCTWARFREGDGRTFLMFNTHFDHRSQPSREKSAELIVKRIAATMHEGEPSLLTGDFNAGENKPAFLALLGGDVGLFDTFRRMHKDAAQVGTGSGFRGRRSGQKIDAVLATPHWQVQAAEIVQTNDEGRYPSDHFPVTAVVSLQGNGAP